MEDVLRRCTAEMIGAPTAALDSVLLEPFHRRVQREREEERHEDPREHRPGDEDDLDHHGDREDDSEHVEDGPHPEADEALFGHG